MLDAIVIGTGGVGSAALYHLARRGLNVLGIDRFPPGHDRGSSHGESRIIRMAYFEHPDYVPLLRRAYQLWGDIEQAVGKKLFHRVGLLEAGPEGGIVVPGVLQSAREHNLAVELLSAAEAQRRFPGFSIRPDHVAVFEPDAGYLLVEECVQTHAALAQAAGAQLAIGEAVVSWQAEQDSIRVRTDRHEYTAARLIITAGAWAGELLADLGVELRVLRKHLHWYATLDERYSPAVQCPTYLFEMPEGIFYGFPEIGASSVKVAQHDGGTPVADPLTDARLPDADERRRLESFIQGSLPGVSRQPVRHTTCFYTMSPDEHFIVDRHRQHRSIVFAAGLSGHGFKFTPVLGEILADLAIDGATLLPIDFLGQSRTSLRQASAH